MGKSTKNALSYSCYQDSIFSWPWCHSVLHIQFLSKLWPKAHFKKKRKLLKDGWAHCLVLKDKLLTHDFFTQNGNFCTVSKCKTMLRHCTSPSKGVTKLSPSVPLTSSICARSSLNLVVIQLVCHQRCFWPHKNSWTKSQNMLLALLGPEKKRVEGTTEAIGKVSLCLLEGLVIGSLAQMSTLCRIMEHQQLWHTSKKHGQTWWRHVQPVMPSIPCRALGMS